MRGAPRQIVAFISSFSLLLHIVAIWIYLRRKEVKMFSVMLILLKLRTITHHSFCSESIMQPVRANALRVDQKELVPRDLFIIF